MTHPLPIVIDTDTASDDAVAIMIAALSGLAEIEAVTVVAGNVGLEQATFNALSTLEVCAAADIPVYPGCDRPLLRPYRSAQAVHGANGMSDIDLPEPHAQPRTEHAVNALLNVTENHAPRSLTLVTLGPLTNIATALQLDHNFLDRFRHVYCMAGSADLVGNISATAEYNVWADPEAAKIVLAHASADQVTLIGCDVSARDAVIGPADQQMLRDLDTRAARFADDINQDVAVWTKAELGLEGYDLPDPIAMAIALDPTLITESETAWASVAVSDEVAGQLIVDRRLSAPAPNVRLVLSADSAGFKKLLFDSCRAEVC